MGGILKVLYDKDGNILSVNGIALADSDIETTAPVLSSSRAQEIAIHHVQTLLKIPASSLPSSSDTFVYRKGATKGLRGSDHVVYQVGVKDAEGTQHLVLVDAMTGVAIEEHMNVHSILRREIVREGTLVWNETYNASGGPASGDAILASKRVYNLFLNMLGYDSYDKQGALMRYVEVPSGLCGSLVGAHWTGSVVRYCVDYLEADLLAHEWAHAYGTGMDALVYNSQPGMLEESFADILAASLDIFFPTDTVREAANATVNPRSFPPEAHECYPDYPIKNPSARWVVGERIFRTANSRDSRGIMDLWNPYCIYADPFKFDHRLPMTAGDIICVSDDGGMVHANAAVPNRVFALAADGFTLEGVWYKGMGIDKALTILFRAKLTCHTPVTTLAWHATCLSKSCQFLLSTARRFNNSQGVLSDPVNPSDCATLDAAIAYVGIKDTKICGSAVYANGFAVLGLYPTRFSRQGGWIEIDIEGPQSDYVYIKLGNFYIGTILTSRETVPGRVVTFLVPSRNMIPETHEEDLNVCISLDRQGWVCNYRDSKQPMKMVFFRNPLVYSLTPPRGSVAGFNLTINGANFKRFTGCRSPSRGIDVVSDDCLIVRIGGITVPIYSFSATQLVVPAPPVASANRANITITLDNDVWFTSAATLQYIYLAYLTSLEILGCSALEPAFNRDVMDYTCNISNLRDNAGGYKNEPQDIVNVTAMWGADANPSVVVEGATQLRTGKNILSIFVTSADNSNSVVYQVIMAREKSVNRQLMSIDLYDDQGDCMRTLTPSFNPYVYVYQCNVSFPVVSVLPSAVPMYAGAAVLFEEFSEFGVRVNSAFMHVKPEIDLGVDDENLLNSDPYYVPLQTYKFYITRLENMDTRLKSAVIFFPNDGPCILTPPFDPDTKTYVCNAPHFISEALYAAEAQFPEATFITPDTNYNQMEFKWFIPGSDDARQKVITITVTSRKTASWSTTYTFTLNFPSLATWTSNPLFNTSQLYSFACAPTRMINWQTRQSEAVDPSRQVWIPFQPNVTSPDAFNQHCPPVIYTIMFPAGTTKAECIGMFWAQTNNSDKFNLDYAHRDVPTEEVQMLFKGRTAFESFCFKYLRESPNTDASLSALSVDTGVPKHKCIFQTKFNSLILSYSCTVHHTIASVTVLALPSHPLASIVNRTRPLNDQIPILTTVPFIALGETVSVVLQGVTLQGQDSNGTFYYNDPTPAYTYVVNITRRLEDTATLDSLALVGADHFRPPFQTDVFGSYVCEVPFEISTLPPVAASATGSGVLQSYNSNLALGVLKETRLTLSVSSQSLENMNNYTVSVFRREKNYNTLANLTIWVNRSVGGRVPCQLAPSFNASETDPGGLGGGYLCIVDREITEVEVQAFALDVDARVEVAGNTHLVLGNNIVVVRVLAKDLFSVRTYIVRLLRASNDATLSELSLVGCTYEPAFRPTLFLPATRSYVCAGIFTDGRQPGALNLSVSTPGATYSILRRPWAQAPDGLNQISVLTLAENQRTKLIYNIFFFKNIMPVSLNKCAPNPCRSVDGQAECASFLTYYTCYCSAKFTGTTCEAFSGARRLLSVPAHSVLEHHPFSVVLQQGLEVKGGGRGLLAANLDIGQLTVDSCTFDQGSTPGIPGSSSYSCSLPYGQSSTVVRVSAADPAAWVNVSLPIRGGSTGGLRDASLPVPDVELNDGVLVHITVTHGTESFNYVLVISRPVNSNNYASSISLSGCPFTFVRDQTQPFTCTVAPEITSVTVSYALEEQQATARFQGGTDLLFDQPNAALLEVTALDGTPRLYFFSILRAFSGDFDVRSITFPSCINNGVAPSWDPAQTEYVCEVEWDTDMLEFSVEIHPEAVFQTNFTNRGLQPGTNDVYAWVVAQNGATQSIPYHFLTLRKSNPTLNNVSILTGLSIVNCTFDAPFRTNRLEYTCQATVPNNRRRITAAADVIAWPTDPRATVSVDIELVVLPTVNTLPILVTAPDGSTSTYSILMSRFANDDSSLAVLTTTIQGANGTACPPPLQPNVFSYSCEVDFLWSTVTITASPNDPDAVIADVSKPFLAPNPPRRLSVGSNTFDVMVFASSGHLSTYTLRITRGRASAEANLLTLSVSNCSVELVAGTQAYLCMVPRGVSTVSVSAVPVSPLAAVNVSIPSDLSPVDGVDLYFGRNVIAVLVVAQDGVTSKSYTVAITRSLLPSVLNRKMEAVAMGVATLDLAGVTVDPLVFSQVIPFMDNFVRAVETLPGFSRHRAGVVGMRPRGTGAGDIQLDLAIGDSASASDPSTLTLQGVFTAEYAKYLDGTGTSFSGQATLSKVSKTGSVSSGQLTGNGAFVDTSMLVLSGRASQFLGDTPMGLETDPTSSPPPSNVGVIVGAVVGGVVALCLVALIIYCCLKGRSTDHVAMDKDEEQKQGEPQPKDPALGKGGDIGLVPL